MFIQELTQRECREELARADLGRLACSRENQPYVTLVHIALDEDCLYSFTMLGQKVEWMRANPRICLEIDHVRSPNDWTTVLAFGKYEELPDSDRHAERVHAHELLAKRVLWWEPGGASLANHDWREAARPIFFRMGINGLTGRRAVPASSRWPGQKVMGALT